jgi:hypothetical protein
MEKKWGVIFILAAVLILSGGCSSTSKGEGFAIYLTKDNVPPVQMETLSHVELENEPIISSRDIITYNTQTHEIKLTNDAFERVCDLEVPVMGKSFMVCVDNQPVYWGALWTPISSISFDGVTIWKPLGYQVPNIITLELGYPSSSFYGGEDPRNNAEIMKSLSDAGKLINMLSLSGVKELPHSMKGYELYSWEESNQWQFTLITGTNRNKTLEEITSGEDFISESGWINIHVIGAEAIKDALSKLPQDEFVLWLGYMREQSDTTSPNIQLPPAQMINDIRDSALRRGLDFQVVTP